MAPLIFNFRIKNRNSSKGEGRRKNRGPSTGDIDPSLLSTRKPTLFSRRIVRGSRFVPAALPLDSLLRPHQPWERYLDERWSLFPVYFPSSLSLSLFSTACTSHGLLRARYHGRSVAVWSIGHVISIKNRWQRNGWCIDSNDPSGSNYFSFYSYLSLFLGSRTTWHRRNLYFPLDRLSTRQENRITCRRVMTFRLPQIHYNYRVWRELSCIDRWKLGNIVANSWKTQRKVN